VQEKLSGPKIRKVDVEKAIANPDVRYRAPGEGCGISARRRAGAGRGREIVGLEIWGAQMGLLEQMAGAVAAA